MRLWLEGGNLGDPLYVLLHLLPVLETLIFAPSLKALSFVLEGKEYYATIRNGLWLYIFIPA